MHNELARNTCNADGDDDGVSVSACSNYSAPSGVPRPPVGSGSGSGNMVKLPSGASEFGMVEAAPNWDDYMTPGTPAVQLELGHSALRM
jgi:hypothetical protein